MTRDLAGFATLLAIALSIATPGVAQDVPFAQRAPAQGSESVLKLGDIMLNAQQRHSKLWYAALLKNWPLAGYELGQLRDAFVEAGSYYRNIPVDAIVAATKSIDTLSRSVKAGDTLGFQQAYGTLTQACNGCHQAAGISFILMKVPSAPTFTNQNFAPPQR